MDTPEKETLEDAISRNVADTTRSIQIKMDRMRDNIQFNAKLRKEAVKPKIRFLLNAVCCGDGFDSHMLMILTSTITGREVRYSTRSSVLYEQDFIAARAGDQAWAKVGRTTVSYLTGCAWSGAANADCELSLLSVHIEEIEQP